MYQIDDLVLFVAVVENKSFLKTSSQFGITQPTVSRKMKFLAEDLGYELFINNGKHVAVTDFGRMLYNIINQKKPCLDELKISVDELISSIRQDVGTLKILLPTVVAEEHITPHISDFIVEYPNINLELHYNQEVVDFKDDSYDLALVLYRPTQANQKFVKLLDNNFSLYCTKEYASNYGIPKNVNELNSHTVVGFIFRDKTTHSQVEFVHNATNLVEVFNLPNKIAVNNLRHSLLLIKGNKVIGPCYEWLCKNEDALIKVLPDYKINISRSVYMLRNPHKNHATIDLFINFLKKRIATTVNQ